MSIMYEALQKTQLENDAQALMTLQDDMTLDDWIDVTIALIIAMLLAAIMVAHYPRFNTIKTIDTPSHLTATVLEIPDEAIIQKAPEVLPTPVPTLENSNTKKQPAEPVLFEDAEYKSKHMLNGVFVSEDEKVAMINNRFFNVGDTVDGMRIVGIEPDKIKLQNEHGILELKIVV